MGLKGDDGFPFEQPNLGADDDQLEIIDGLDNLAWEVRIDLPQYEEVEDVIDNKIQKSTCLDTKLAKEIKEQREQQEFRQFVKNLW